jgi:hypothetical protein
MIASKSCFLLAAAAAALAARALAEPWTARVGDDWRPVDMARTEVVAGSALDMSRLVEAPAGKHGRVVIGAEGHLVFEKRPDLRVRFFGCSISPEPLLGRSCKSKDDIRRWCASVRRQGYNLVRPHFLDHYLTGASATDLAFDPEAVDRFDYLVACLKENGIYLYLDAMTSWRGYDAGPGWSAKAKQADYKNRIFYEPAVRDHWRRGVEALLTHTNPYTKTRLADDPAVAVLLYYNEQNVNFYSGMRPGFAAPWRDWLRARYTTGDALRRAWVDGSGRPLLPADASFDSVPLFDQQTIWKDDPRNRDAGLFVRDTHAELYGWFTAQARQIGYAGLVTHYDWLNHLGVQALRSRVPVISMHGYHAHPSDFTAKGSTVSQESAVGTAGRFLTGMLTTRYNGRPLLITEYGHVFWNRYRHEEGLLVGAYAALQDTDGLMAHANPVILSGDSSPIKPFSVGHDPVARAAQAVAGFAWFRRDVAPSMSRVEVTLRDAEIFDKARHARALSADQAKLTLLTGVGLACPDEPAPTPKLPPSRKPDLRLPVFGTSEVRAEAMFSEVVERAAQAHDLTGAVSALRKAGILSPANRTSPTNGLFESDTGQLTLDAPRRRLRVVSPRLAGATLDPAAATDPVKLGPLTIESTSVPASVTAISVDGLPLDTSTRILLVYATDALNEGMRFTSPERGTLDALGHAQALLRTGTLRLTLATPHARAFKLWALGLDGRRTEPLPSAPAGAALSLTLDTRRLTSATPFFELAAE